MTGDTGITLGLDLFELYRAGKQSLPSVAAEFTVAAGSLTSAGGSADPLFTRPAIFGGNKGPAHAEWMELKGSVERFLAQTSDNLLDTGTALVLAANTYAASDEIARQELDRLKHENGVG
jgi:hypothetical protein